MYNNIIDLFNDNYFTKYAKYIAGTSELIVYDIIYIEVNDYCVFITYINEHAEEKYYQLFNSDVTFIEGPATNKGYYRVCTRFNDKYFI